MKFTTALVTLSLAILGQGIHAQRLGAASASQIKKGLSNGGSTASAAETSDRRYLTFSEDEHIVLDEESKEKLRLAALSVQEHKNQGRRLSRSKKMVRRHFLSFSWELVKCIFGIILTCDNSHSILCHMFLILLTLLLLLI